MNDDEILQLQRQLRKRLFEGSTAIRWRPARELAAQLLLYLDDPQTCWQLTTEWLREMLGADRVDGGYGGFIDVNGHARSYVVQAESRGDADGLPTLLGTSFHASEPGIQAVWRTKGLAMIADVSQERTFTARLRQTLQSMGTSAKLALPLRDGPQPIGLICADWTRLAPQWNSEACNQIAIVAHSMLGPIFAKAALLSQPLMGASGRVPAGSLDAFEALTPAELKVARLIMNGLSYKEIARHLDRSVSTVDHQLRSIREKVGTRSTARLIHLLNERLLPDRLS